MQQRFRTTKYSTGNSFWSDVQPGGSGGSAGSSKYAFLPLVPLALGIVLPSDSAISPPYAAGISVDREHSKRDEDKRRDKNSTTEKGGELLSARFLGAVAEVF